MGLLPLGEGSPPGSPEMQPLVTRTQGPNIEPLMMRQASLRASMAPLWCLTVCGILTGQRSSILCSKPQKHQCGHLITLLTTKTFQELRGDKCIRGVLDCVIREALLTTAGTMFPRTPFSVLPGWCEPQLKWFLKTLTTVTTEPSNSTPGHARRRTEDRDPGTCTPVSLQNSSPRPNGGNNPRVHPPVNGCTSPAPATEENVISHQGNEVPTKATPCAR